MASFNDRIHKTELENMALRTSVDLALSKIDKLEKENVSLREELTNIQNSDDINDEITDRISELEHRANTQEDYSRKINLIFEGVPEEAWEKAEITQEKIRKMLRDKLELDDINFDAVHRFGKSTALRNGDRDSNSTPPKPRPIIVRFHRLCDRNEVLRKSHMLSSDDQRVFVYEDLCIASQEIVRSKLEERRTAKRNGYVAYFRGTRLIKYPRRTAGQSGDDGAAGGGETESDLNSNSDHLNSRRSVRGARGGRGTNPRGAGRGGRGARSSTNAPAADAAQPDDSTIEKDDQDDENEEEINDSQKDVTNEKQATNANKPSDIATRSKTKVNK